MSEQSQVLKSLGDTQVLDLFEWVARTAYQRVLEDYDEDAGHTQTTVGTLAHGYLVDLFDRASGCGRYSLPDDAPAGEGLDLLRAGITAEAFEAMPRIEPGTVVRSNYNFSAGWACGTTRWVLQSHEFGRVDRIDWSRKSHTKRGIAAAPFARDPHALFAYSDPRMEQEDLESPGSPLILAHGFHRATGAYEMYLGRSRASSLQDGRPWHWRHPVASGGPDHVRPTQFEWSTGLPGAPVSTDVPDMPVRLRPERVTQGTEQE